ncbi:MAG TPA: SDR family oxidoreductase [Bacillota bacterium]|nr:SDR family oxidoreductase [Bacillota bacterium]
MRLKNKLALITGSSRGIGQQIALGLAEEGCNVIVHGRIKENNAKTIELLKRYDIHIDSVAGELSSEASVQGIIDQVFAKHPGIDILYNNAAIQNTWKPIWEITQAEWLETFQINLFSMIKLCTAFAPGMKERGYGRIINLTSGIKDIPNLAPYSVSKAAVDKYTKDLAAELRGTGVLINFLDPGWLRTDLGGPNGEHEVETVLPGALVPVLFENDGPSGEGFSAQDYRGKTI